MEDPYLKRAIDPYIDRRLRSAGAILIEGAKWCGKTRTAKEKAASVLFMQDPDSAQSHLRTADTKPSLLLEGDVPRLIDEWQTAPVLWDAVRFAVDERNRPGQFILTGSSVPQDDAVMHTGTGRISRVLMRPMSLYESLESNGTVSLKELFDGGDIAAHSEMTLENVAFALIRGGWPGSVGLDEEDAVVKIQDYVDSIVNIDVSRVDGVRRNPDAMWNLMRSLARNVSTMATMSTIQKDMMGDDDTVSDKTVASYINTLRRIFIVEDQQAWNPSLRSKTFVRGSPKRHFVDPSIPAAVMRLSPKTILNDFNTFGLLFESLCVRDLRVYSQVFDGKIFHYHDRNGLEADAVIHLKDGRWAAVEVKLGTKEIDKGAENLLKLKDKIDFDKMNAPSFLMVLTATEYAYRRDDGVFVVPIGCLKD